MDEEAAAPRQARVDRGEDVIVGGNKYRLQDGDGIEILEVDKAKVREAQIARINRIKAARDEAKAQAALDALRDGAKGQGNLLALAVDCARERCTLGEISLAMEAAFGRHGVDGSPVTGMSGGALQGDEGVTRLVEGVASFAR